MKKILIFAVCIFLFGCIYGNKSLLNETEASLRAFAKTGETTNYDVLRRFHKPFSKNIMSDGTYSYSYYMQDSTNEKKFFSHIEFVKTKSKHIRFVFDSGNKLVKMEYNTKNTLPTSKYQYVETISTPTKEEKDFRKLYENLKLGTNTGTIFREWGRPDITYEEDGIEYWGYSIYNKDFNYKTVYEAYNDINKTMVLYIGIANNKVIKKYTSVVTELTQEEKAFLKSLR